MGRAVDGGAAAASSGPAPGTPGGVSVPATWLGPPRGGVSAIGGASGPASGGPGGINGPPARAPGSGNSRPGPVEPRGRGSGGGGPPAAVPPDPGGLRLNRG